MAIKLSLCGWILTSIAFFCACPVMADQQQPLKNQYIQAMLDQQDRTRPGEAASDSERGMQMSFHFVIENVRILLFNVPMNRTTVRMQLLSYIDGLPSSILAQEIAKAESGTYEQQLAVAKQVLDSILLNTTFYKKLCFRGPLDHSSDLPTISVNTQVWATAIGLQELIINGQGQIKLQAEEVHGWKLVVLNLLLLNDVMKPRLRLVPNLVPAVRELVNAIRPIPTQLVTQREYASFVQNSQVYFSELRYSSSRTLLDVAGQWFAGDVHGYGVLFLKDLSESAHLMVYEGANLQTDTKEAKQSIASLMVHGQMDVVDLQTATKIADTLKQDEQTINAIVDSYLHLRSSMSLNYQHINEFGSTWILDMNLSRLIPSRPHQKSDGVTYSAAVELAYLDLNSDVSNARERVAPGIRISVAWQNEVPYKLLTDAHLLDTTEDRVGHWSVQGGVLFSQYFETDPNPGGTIGGFLRYRDRRNFWEVSANAGLSTDGKPYVTVGLTKAFP